MANVTSQDAATSSGDDLYLQKQMHRLSNSLVHSLFPLFMHNYLIAMPWGVEIHDGQNSKHE